MWIFTPNGFYSAVQKYGTDHITIRSRVSGDLDKLREFMPGLGKEQKGGGTDYPYRATVSKADFAEGMKRLAETVDYDNFKGETMRVSGRAREEIYHKVWDIHFDMEGKIKKREAEIRAAQENAKRQRKMF